jgi:hypothetical protein
MVIFCQQCSRTGTIDEYVYAGKRVRLRCPYCSHEFVFSLPENSAVDGPDGRRLSDPAAAMPMDGERFQGLVLEARRIARLIISEIKLYNQDKIDRTDSRKEILDMLQTDLMRGKEHYNHRIAGKLPLLPDYFNETIDEILLAGKS